MKTRYLKLHLFPFNSFHKPRPYCPIPSSRVNNQMDSGVIAPPKSRNPFKIVAHYIKNDPFARVSFMFGGVVLTVLLIIEAFIPKQPKKIKPQIAVLPPTVGHFTVNREKEMSKLLSFCPSVISLKPSVVMVTGPSGSGKTNLASQFVPRFTSVSAPLISKKESMKPIVMYIDASNSHLFEQSIRYAARSLGLKSSEVYSTGNNREQALETIFKKLGDQKAKWLLVFDGVNDTSVSSLIQNVMKKFVVSNRKFRKGYILITSSNSLQMESSSLTASDQLSLDKGLSPSEAYQLFHKLANTTPSDPQVDEQINELISFLNCSPLLISLAALTTHLYSYFYQATNGITDHKQLINDYRDMVKESRDSHVTNRLTELYIEALCAVDNYFVHSIDFLSSCDLGHLVPSSAVSSHLKNSFYKLPPVSTTASPLEDTPTTDTPTNLVTTPPSYLSLIKSKLPFMGGENNQSFSIPNQPPPPPVIVNYSLSSLLLSPFVQTYTRYNMDLLSVHSACRASFVGHFLKYTVPRIEEEHLETSRVHWNETAWFKKFRSFDLSSAMTKFHSSLPGLKEGNVLNEEQFDLLVPQSTTSYLEYVHMISHNHRVTQTLSNEAKYLSRDPEDIAMRSYLRPHLLALLSNQLAERDQLRCQASLLSVESALGRNDDIFTKYNALMDKARESFGSTHFELGNIMTSLAELYYYSGRYREAETLLFDALKIQEGIDERDKTSTHNLDIATSLSLLGLVYSALGEKQKCRDTLEKSLLLFQTIPADGEIPKKQRKLVSTTVTDLGHAYLFTGDVISAKRYLDLAIIAQRNIYGSDDHQEVARTLNVLSIVYALLGDNVESRNFRSEAGKIQSELLTLSDIV